MDLLGEVVLGRTHQTDDVNSFELAPRIGVRFHVFSRDVRNLRPTREKVPRHRVVVRDTMRLEWRNLYYSGAQPNESSGRFATASNYLCR
jgi:hypothetical protein